MSTASAAPVPPPAAVAFSAAEAVAATGGRWLGRAEAVTVRGLVIDSRAVTPGCAFACLAGSRSDGHDHAPAAVAAGAAWVIASRELSLPVPVLVMTDVAAALAALASLVRTRRSEVAWFGVAGANGKTTTKELLRRALETFGPCHATAGNLNNHLGVPMTVFALPADARSAVIELGGDRVGEIEHLARIVRPQVALCTSIGPAHLEGYGNLDGVAVGESAVFAHVPSGGACLLGGHGLAATAVANGADAARLVALCRVLAGPRGLRVVGGAADGVGEILAGRCLADGTVVLEGPGGPRPLAIHGAHNLANACLALEAVVAAGFDRAQALDGLARMQAVAGRLRRLALGPHVLWDDAYNANPASMAAGLGVLAQGGNAVCAVLGAMGELGPGSVALHRQVGAVAAGLGVPLLVVSGGDADHIAAGCREAGGNAELVADAAVAVVAVRSRLAGRPPGAAVLVKASHSARLDRVVDGLLEAGAC
jgi:UDP-N-acetylmuramoyl-tripeptide--D-alanyl-D-alanine ligase